MAIQLRRGNETDLDISRLQPGETAVCLDTGKIIVKLTGGNYLTLTDTSALRAIVDGKADSNHNHSGVYAPASHTHAQADITGLADTLAGKADSNHNHSGVYAPASHSHDAAVASSGGLGGSSGFMTGADKEWIDGQGVVLWDYVNNNNGDLLRVAENTSFELPKSIAVFTRVEIYYVTKTFNNGNILVYTAARGYVSNGSTQKIYMQYTSSANVLSYGYITINNKTFYAGPQSIMLAQVVGYK